jgi:ankyrin repeat protein
MRRFFRCTLRQLLLLILALSILLAILAPRWWASARERKLAAATEELLAAASTGDVPRARAAIAAGADVGFWDGIRATPLGEAIRGQNLELTDLLLAAGADPNQYAVDKEGLPLAVAARRENIAIARRLLSAGADPTLAQVIPICVEGGYQKSLALYFPQAATGQMVTRAIRSQLPPEKKLSMVRLLLAQGAPWQDPSLVRSSATAMDLAVNQKDAQLADLLREFGAPYTAREAVVFGRFEELRQMIEENPDLVHQRFRYQYLPEDRQPTLLALALEHAHRDIALYLIDKGGAPSNDRVLWDHNLLDQAVMGGDPVLVKLLVERGFAVNPPDKTPPLYYAAFYGHGPAAFALIELGANVKHELVLKTAVSRADPDMVRLLLAAGADARQPGLLELAVWHSTAEVTALLVAAGADTNTTDKYGRTPLKIAEDRGRGDVAKVLRDAMGTPSPPAN